MEKEKLWTGSFILAWLASFLMSSAFYMLTPTLPLYLTETLSLPESRVGVVMSTYTIASLFTRFFSGYMVDMTSRKRLYIIGLIFYTASFAGYLVAATVAAFMILRFLQGIMWGVTSVSGNTVAIDIIPPSKRGQGVGFYGISFNMAMAIAPWIAVEIYGKWGYEILIASCLACGFSAAIVASFIKTKPRPTVVRAPISLDRFILLNALPISFNLVLYAVSYGMIVSYGVLFAESIHVSNTGYLFIFMAIGLGVSRVVSGRIVDKGHIHKVALAALAMLSIALVIFALSKTTWVFCLMSFFCGVAYGTSVPAFQLLFLGMAQHNQRGTANSTYLTSFDVGIGGGMLLGGLITTLSNLSTAFLVSAFLAIVAVFYYYFISRHVYNKHRINTEQELAL